MTHLSGPNNLTLNSDLRHESSSPPRLLVELLETAGVNFNGINPCDILVHDIETYRRILTRGSLGSGGAYMDGLWDCQRLWLGRTGAVRRAALRGAGLRYHALPRAASRPAFGESQLPGHGHGQSPVSHALSAPGETPDPRPGSPVHSVRPPAQPVRIPLQACSHHPQPCARAGRVPTVVVSRSSVHASDRSSQADAAEFRPPVMDLSACSASSPASQSYQPQPACLYIPGLSRIQYT